MCVIEMERTLRHWKRPALVQAFQRLNILYSSSRRTALATVGSSRQRVRNFRAEKEINGG